MILLPLRGFITQNADDRYFSSCDEVRINRDFTILDAIDRNVLDAGAIIRVAQDSLRSARHRMIAKEHCPGEG